MLLISADLDELIGLSDTLKVILRGRLVADVDPARHARGARLGDDRRGDGGGRAMTRSDLSNCARLGLATRGARRSPSCVALRWSPPSSCSLAGDPVVAVWTQLLSTLHAAGRSSRSSTGDVATTSPPSPSPSASG